MRSSPIKAVFGAEALSPPPEPLVPMETSLDLDAQEILAVVKRP